VKHGKRLDRRAKVRQKVLIQSWKPWERSIGAKTPQGKARSSRNAYKTGVTEAKELIRQFKKLLKEENKSIM
jgi:hypothetical protein